NLESTHGLALTEHIATLLAPALGRLPAHDVVAKAAARAARDHISLADAIYADRHLAARLADTDITRPQIESALRPESFLGATGESIRRALAAHADCESFLAQ